MENKWLTTEKGCQVRFAMKLIPSDVKWASSFSGELNNAATYFSPFANVSQSNKRTMFGSIGGSDATWQPWSSEKRLEVARKVQNFKKHLKDPDKKQKSEVTKFIAQNKSRQSILLCCSINFALISNFYKQFDFYLIFLVSSNSNIYFAFPSEGGVYTTTQKICQLDKA